MYQIPAAKRQMMARSPMIPPTSGPTNVVDVDVFVRDGLELESVSPAEADEEWCVREDGAQNADSEDTVGGAVDSELSASALVCGEADSRGSTEEVSAGTMVDGIPGVDGLSVWVMMNQLVLVGTVACQSSSSLPGGLLSEVCRGWSIWLWSTSGTGVHSTALRIE